MFVIFVFVQLAYLTMDESFYSLQRSMIRLARVTRNLLEWVNRFCLDVCNVIKAMDLVRLYYTVLLRVQYAVAFSL